MRCSMYTVSPGGCTCTICDVHPCGDHHTAVLIHRRDCVNVQRVSCTRGCACRPWSQISGNLIRKEGRRNASRNQFANLGVVLGVYNTEDGRDLGCVSILSSYSETLGQADFVSTGGRETSFFHTGKPAVT